MYVNTTALIMPTTTQVETYRISPTLRRLRLLPKSQPPSIIQGYYICLIFTNRKLSNLQRYCDVGNEQSTLTKANI